MAIKVFYVDDEIDLCENFAEYFSTEDVRVKTFTDPAQCILESKSNPPDIFFLDYRLPRTTGDELARELPNSIPKYLITGDISVRTDYKFNGVFTKPYKVEEITKVIESVVEIGSA